MSYSVTCTVCGRPSSRLTEHSCTSCGEPLEVRLFTDFDKSDIVEDDFSVWRYREFFPYLKNSDIITLGEGWTPLVKFSNDLYFKMESLNPTGSFKDRGSTTLISALHDSVRNKGDYISEDSSGNAGASVAAYAARAGIISRIYVPEDISGPKFNQIRSFGSEIVKVSGARRQVAETARKPEKNKHYVGHILHPLFRDGIRSLSYELAEQLNWQVADRIYLPVSAGTLLLGVIAGFQHLRKSRIVDAIPRIVACQTTRISPLYHRLRKLKYMPPQIVQSFADALVSTEPPLLDRMVGAMQEIDGDTEIVEEEEIVRAHSELAHQGFFVEPSSAVAYAGYKKQLRDNRNAVKGKIIIILTGSGLKSTLIPRDR